MRIRKQIKSYLLLLILSFVLKSCVIDIKPLLYRVKNCTEDTLYIELSNSDSLTDNVYWGMHSWDTVHVLPDTTSVYVHGEKVIFNNYYYALPNSTSSGIYPLDKDTYYVYAIKKQIITHYTLDEIRIMKLYDRRGVTKKDFHNRLFEYRPAR